MRSSVIFELNGMIRIPGFKPKLWILASEAGLGGWVADSEKEDTVMLRLEGGDEEIKSFIQKLPSRLYPSFSLRELQVVKREELFASEGRRPFKLLGEPLPTGEIRPDFAPCPDCLNEMLDSRSRRFCFPFWSCSKCGPAYSAMLRSPFIRKNTYLSSFPPCSECRKEASDQNDLLHNKSELLCCPKCGPRLFYVDNSGRVIDSENPVCAARRALSHGEILALQSMFGGFQIFFDAFNSSTIRRLRNLKKIPDRPIAVMARNIDIVKKYCLCSTEEEELLLSPACPVVILPIRPDPPDDFPLDLLASNCPYLGISLPPTSLMHLLFEHTCSENDASTPPFDILGTVSNNWTGDFNAGIDELFHSLSGTVDSFLCHDLRIGMDCSSSVAVIREGRPQILRRSRGYAPCPIRLKTPLRRAVTAFGSDDHSSVALGYNGEIIPSQQFGPIVSAASGRFLGQMVEHLTMLYDFVPDVVACDMNMKLFSSDAASVFAEKYAIPLITVQRHHAHALACMAENGLTESLAIVFDDGSPGPDGVYWGAELLEARIDRFIRLGTFKAASLPGGDNALARPVRQFAGRMIDAGVELSDAWLERLHVDRAEADIWRMNRCQQGRFSLSHAATRLFDAVSAGLGVAPDFCTYAGQSSANLVNAAMRCPSGMRPGADALKHFHFDLKEKEEDRMAYIDWTPMFREFAEPSWIRPENIPELAMAFHVALSEAVLAMVEYGAARSSLRDVVLSGNVFMNGILSDLTSEKLRTNGFSVHLHHDVPLDDSGICVGQAYHAGISD